MKIAWLERVDRETRAMDPRIVQVMASCHAVHEVVLVANSQGTLAADVRPLVRFNVSVIASRTAGANRAMRAPAAATRCRSWLPTTGRCSWRARRCARRW